MQFELGTFPVTEVVLGDTTRLDNQVLHIDQESTVGMVLEDIRIKDCKIEIVRPKENTRIIHLRDVVEPRTKVGGDSCIFPGILGDTKVVGEGRTNRLSGIAIVESAPLLGEPRAVFGHSADSFLDMTGPGALSPFIDTINVVLCLEMNPALSDLEYESSIQRAGLKVAAHLAETTIHLVPPQLEVFTLGSANSSLPNVVYIHQIASTGRDGARGTDFYGLRLGEILPTFVRATEILDGALVADAFGASAIKAPTWEIQNNPIILDLLRRHGNEINFLGTIVMRIRYTMHQEKLLISSRAAKLARALGADGAIVTWPEAGNMFIEAMLTTQECERAGIHTVLMTFEGGGTTGDEAPLLYMSPFADAIVSTGSLSRPIRVPPVGRVVGGSTLMLNPESEANPIPADGALELDRFLPMFAAVDHYGFTKQSCIAY